MFVLGVLALFQMIVLPGALILRLFQVSLKGVKWLWVAFGLSLVANYWLVLTLSLLKLYTQPVILAVFVCETALLGWLIRPSLGKSIGDAWAGAFYRIGSWLQMQYRQVQQLFEDSHPG